MQWSVVQILLSVACCMSQSLATKPAKTDMEVPQKLHIPIEMINICEILHVMPWCKSSHNWCVPPRVFGYKHCSLHICKTYTDQESLLTWALWEPQFVRHPSSFLEATSALIQHMQTQAVEVAAGRSQQPARQVVWIADRPLLCLTPGPQIWGQKWSHPRLQQMLSI